MLTKNTKIVMTLGPASNCINTLKSMLSVCNTIRLNRAHFSYDELEKALKMLTKLKNDYSFSIVLDLQGAKTRIGKMPSTDKLPDNIRLVNSLVSDDISVVPVPHTNVFKQTTVGDSLLLNDRKIVLKVIEMNDTCIHTQVIKNGPISSFKGINSPDKSFEFAQINNNDQIAIEIANSLIDVDYAVSFVNEGKQADIISPYINKEKSKLIAKIEQKKAFDNLYDIDFRFDETWLCRGDLGAEAGLADLGKLQNNFIKCLAKMKKPALIAGEVLGSMVEMPQPSRAEIVQLYDAINSGFSGFVLSDETAVGKNIEKIVSFISDMIKS